MNLSTPPPPALTREGAILPPVRPAADVSGWLVVIFIDDFHLARRIRRVFAFC